MENQKIHTIKIFEHLYNFIKSVLPQELDQEVDQVLQQLNGDYNLTLETIEETVIVYGQKIWPYRKAYSELLSEYQGKLGEQFLLAKLSATLKKKYAHYKQEGGSFRQLHSGSDISIFTPKERQKIGEILIAVHSDIQQHVTQAVHGTQEKLFIKKVKEFQHVLVDIEDRLNLMRQMANDEQDHPRLAAEIRDHVKTFELGLSAIGPESSFDDLINTHDHFVGRKDDLKKIKAW